MPAFEVRRDDIRTTRVVPGEAPEPAEGVAVLAVERFGLTANNFTYAVFGEAMAYWNFFPAEDPAWGRVPVWGFGEVVSSRAAGVEPGQRYYGFFPLAGDLTVRPQQRGRGLVDAAPHRAELPPIYNEYVLTPPDAPKPDETLLLRPLFGTSFLLAAFLDEQRSFGATTVVLSSASSKTAYGLAFLLSRHEAGPAVVGLTSARNRAFVESLGVYDAVVEYGEIADGLAGDAPLVYVDMAGDGAVRAAVHGAAGERLRHSAVVGAAHWDQAGPTPRDLPGPRPAFFFAPDHLLRLRTELGGAELGRRMETAWDAFIARVGDWLEIEHGEGAEAVERVWRALADGSADPRRGHVLRL